MSEKPVEIAEFPAKDFKIHPKPSSSLKKSSTELQQTKQTTNEPQKKPRFSEKNNENLVIFLRKSLKKCDTISAFFSCLGLCIAWVENDVFFNNNNQSNAFCHVLRGIVSFLCFVVHYFLTKRYRIKLELLKSQRIIYQRTQLFSSSLRKFYFLEIFVNYLHCPPFFDFVLPNEQLGIHFDISLDAYISVVMLARLYVFFRLFDHYSFWTGERARRVCKINGFAPNSRFALKAYLKSKPYVVLVICLGFSILLFGFALRTFERPYTSPSRRFNFNYLWNSFWCVVVTMTTIGYGDIYPQTHLGRLVIIVACIWGVFILSLFVVALNNTITLSKEESKAFEQITQRDTIRKGLQRDAGTIILKLMKLNISKKHKTAIKTRILMRMDLFGLVSRFKVKRRNANKISKKVADILSEMHEEVNKEVGEVIDNIQPLKKILPNINETEEIQGAINEKTLEIFENSKKLMTLLINLNDGREKTSVKSLKDVEIEYDFLGNPLKETQNAEILQENGETH